jgi:hypothetical protein
MSYKVDIKREGRGGDVIYVEEGKGLQFEWDINSEGVEIYVPTDYEWDGFCEKRGAEWAQGRRQEILEVVAQEYCRQKAKKGKWKIADHWIFISFENYMIGRFLDWILGNKWSTW